MPEHTTRSDSLDMLAQSSPPRKRPNRKVVVTTVATTTPMVAMTPEIALSRVVACLARAQDALALAATEMATFARTTDLLQDIAVVIALDLRDTCSHTHELAETIEAWRRMERREHNARRAAESEAV